MMTERASSLAIAVCLLAAASAPAAAQQAGAADPTPSSATGAQLEPREADSGATGDVIITARRREERSQDVPVAASAFGGKQLEATRTFNLRDVQQLAPSLVVTVTNPRNTSINIRGLGNNVSVYNDGLEPAVGVYLDQVYLARPGQTVFDLVDLDRVEVLRGPQGTLFGKNTSAGAVVITTRADLPAGGGRRCQLRQLRLSPGPRLCQRRADRRHAGEPPVLQQDRPGRLQL